MNTIVIILAAMFLALCVAFVIVGGMVLLWFWYVDRKQRKRQKQ